jgi:hypothetical protein
MRLPAIAITNSHVPVLLMLYNSARVRLTTTSGKVASLSDARLASATKEINQISADIVDANSSDPMGAARSRLRLHPSTALRQEARPRGFSWLRRSPASIGAASSMYSQEVRKNPRSQRNCSRLDIAHQIFAYSPAASHHRCRVTRD